MTKDVEEGFYWYWLNNIPRVGNIKIHNLLDRFKSPKNIYSASFNDYTQVAKISINDAKQIDLAKKSEYIYNDYKKLIKSDMNFTYPVSNDYPKALLNLNDYPVNLFYYGKLADENKPIVSIIGTRECTNYGRKIAYEFGKAFAKMGIQVISGMALGVDYYGQKGAIDNGGYSLGVLGCGVDLCYPRYNYDLYEKLKIKGGLLSEYKPHTPAIPASFPMRNRIISGLSDAIVVVEARRKSGTKITVEHALENGKDIFVVPGRIGDELSYGCLEMLSDGANLILEPADICKCERVNEKLFNSSQSKTISSQNTQFRHNSLNSPIASPRNMVYSELDLYPCSLDDLVKKTGLPLSNVVENLLELELEGLVEETAKNYYAKIQIS